MPKKKKAPKKPKAKKPVRTTGTAYATKKPKKMAGGY